MEMLLESVPLMGRCDPDFFYVFFSFFFLAEDDLDENCKDNEHSYIYIRLCLSFLLVSYFTFISKFYR